MHLRNSGSQSAIKTGPWNINLGNLRALLDRGLFTGQMPRNSVNALKVDRYVTG